MILKKCIFLYLIFEIVSAQNSAAPFQLSIIHFNDFHSRFEPTTLSAGTCSDLTKCVGGFSRLYAQIMTMLETNPKSILLNAGDSFQGTLWYTIGRWNVTQQFINKLPIDAETIGNHEFDHGIQGLVPYIKALKHPVVASNIDDSLEPDFQGIYNKSVVIERNGRKIGVIGVVSTDYPIICNSENLKFLDESASVNAEAERLVREEGVFTNIVLSHSGYETDKLIASNASSKISLIVGAHSHTFLWTGDNPPGPAIVEGPYPTIIESRLGHKVLVTQASAFCRYLGNITIFLDDAGEILDYSGAPIFLDNHFPQDESINAELQYWKNIVDVEGGQIVGNSLVRLSTTGCYYKECSLGNFVTDAMVYAYTKVVPETYWTEAAIGFINAGGLRTDIEPGDITYNALITSQPFENTFDFGVLTGQDIKALLELAVQDFDPGNPTRSLNLLQVSGIKLEYDLSRNRGDRVVSVKIRCQNCTIPVYGNLDAKRDYNIVVNSYLMRNTSRYEVLSKKTRNRKVGRKDTDVLREYVRNNSPLFQEEFGRILFK
ncbi:unnamed protein product [Phyllotreta striolata]|uniref:apyrase n=1 Tax=Phyllotreta striolata TaxID=444603 RepID=A0A9N9TDP1_PHYSR|nr:unnamed protein product [Phyllotreta striolata]